MQNKEQGQKKLGSGQFTQFRPPPLENYQEEEKAQPSGPSGRRKPIHEHESPSMSGLKSGSLSGSSSGQNIKLNRDARQDPVDWSKRPRQYSMMVNVEPKQVSTHLKLSKFQTSQPPASGKGAKPRRRKSVIYKHSTSQLKYLKYKEPVVDNSKLRYILQYSDDVLQDTLNVKREFLYSKPQADGKNSYYEFDNKKLDNEFFKRTLREEKGIFFDVNVLPTSPRKAKSPGVSQKKEQQIYDQVIPEKKSEYHSAVDSNYCITSGISGKKANQSRHTQTDNEHKNAFGSSNSSSLEFECEPDGEKKMMRRGTTFSMLRPKNHRQRNNSISKSISKQSQNLTKNQPNQAIKLFKCKRTGSLQLNDNDEMQPQDNELNSSLSSAEKNEQVFQSQQENTFNSPNLSHNNNLSPSNAFKIIQFKDGCESLWDDDEFQKMGQVEDSLFENYTSPTMKDIQAALRRREIEEIDRRCQKLVKKLLKPGRQSHLNGSSPAMSMKMGRQQTGQFKPESQVSRQDESEVNAFNNTQHIKQELDEASQNLSASLANFDQVSAQSAKEGAAILAAENRRRIAKTAQKLKPNKTLREKSKWVNSPIITLNMLNRPDATVMITDISEENDELYYQSEHGQLRQGSLQYQNHSRNHEGESGGRVRVNSFHEFHEKQGASRPGLNIKKSRFLDSSRHNQILKHYAMEDYWKTNQELGRDYQMNIGEDPQRTANGSSHDDLRALLGGRAAFEPNSATFPKSSNNLRELVERHKDQRGAPHRQTMSRHSRPISNCSGKSVTGSDESQYIEVSSKSNENGDSNRREDFQDQGARSRIFNLNMIQREKKGIFTRKIEQKKLLMLQGELEYNLHEIAQNGGITQRDIDKLTKSKNMKDLDQQSASEPMMPNQAFEKSIFIQRATDGQLQQEISIQLYDEQSQSVNFRHHNPGSNHIDAFKTMVHDANGSVPGQNTNIVIVKSSARTKDNYNNGMNTTKTPAPMAQLLQTPGFAGNNGNQQTTPYLPPYANSFARPKQRNSSYLRDQSEKEHSAGIMKNYKEFRKKTNKSANKVHELQRRSLKIPNINRKQRKKQIKRLYKPTKENEDEDFIRNQEEQLEKLKNIAEKLKGHKLPENNPNLAANANLDQCLIENVEEIKPNRTPISIIKCKIVDISPLDRQKRNQTPMVKKEKDATMSSRKQSIKKGYRLQSDVNSKNHASADVQRQQSNGISLKVQFNRDSGKSGQGIEQVSIQNVFNDLRDTVAPAGVRQSQPDNKIRRSVQEIEIYIDNPAQDEEEAVKPETKKQETNKDSCFQPNYQMKRLEVPIAKPKEVAPKFKDEQPMQQLALDFSNSATSAPIQSLKSDTFTQAVRRDGSENGHQTLNTGSRVKQKRSTSFQLQSYNKSEDLERQNHRNSLNLQQTSDVQPASWMVTQQSPNLSQTCNSQADQNINQEDLKVKFQKTHQLKLTSMISTKAVRDLSLSKNLRENLKNINKQLKQKTKMKADLDMSSANTRNQQLYLYSLQSSANREKIEMDRIDTEDAKQISSSCHKIDPRMDWNWQDTLANSIKTANQHDNPFRLKVQGTGFAPENTVKYVRISSPVRINGNKTRSRSQCQNNLNSAATSQSEIENEVLADDNGVNLGEVQQLNQVPASPTHKTVIYQEEAFHNILQDAQQDGIQTESGQQRSPYFAAPSRPPNQMLGGQKLEREERSPSSSRRISQNESAEKIRRLQRMINEMSPAVMQPEKTVEPMSFNQFNLIHQKNSRNGCMTTENSDTQLRSNYKYSSPGKETENAAKQISQRTNQTQKGLKDKHIINSQQPGSPQQLIIGKQVTDNIRRNINNDLDELQNIFKKKAPVDHRSSSRKKSKQQEKKCADNKKQQIKNPRPDTSAYQTKIQHGAAQYLMNTAGPRHQFTSNATRR